MTFRVYTNRLGSLELVAIVQAKSGDAAITAAITKKVMSHYSRYSLVAKKQAQKVGER